MKKKKFRLRPHYVVLAALFLLLGISTTIGKYRTAFSTYESTVTFVASLAENVVLQEHNVARQKDGTYELVTKEYAEKYDDDKYTAEELTTTGQTYTLIPGLDIPKDPHIVIEGKTDIPAYLYIEIVDAGDTVTIDGENVDLTEYSVTNVWKWVSSDTTTNKATYVYVGDGTVAKEITSDMTVYILEDNKVEVSQHVKCNEDNVTKLITIYAYLVEAASVGTP